MIRTEEKTETPVKTEETHTFAEFSKMANEYLANADIVIDSLSSSNFEKTKDLLDIENEKTCLRSNGEFVLIAAYCGFVVRRKIATKIEATLRQGYQLMRDDNVVEALKLIWELGFNTVVITTEDDDKNCLLVGEATENDEIANLVKKLIKWKGSNRPLFKEGFNMMKPLDLTLALALKKRKISTLIDQAQNCHALGTSHNSLYHESKRIFGNLEVCINSLHPSEFNFYYNHALTEVKEDKTNTPLTSQKWVEGENLLRFLIDRKRK